MTQTTFEEELATQEQAALRPECMFCLERKNDETIKEFPCGENACRQCLNDAFDGATYDESRFPVRCSHREIVTAEVNTFLYRAVSAAYEQKAPEYRTKNRIYCFDRNCAHWIPPHEIVGERATCTSCRKATCIVCKDKVHDGDCPDDPAHQAFLVASKERGYRQCKGCMRMVELSYGCNRIESVESLQLNLVYADLSRCLCGAQFCYQCGGEWKTCDCSLWQRENLIWEQAQDRPFGFVDGEDELDPGVHPELVAVHGALQNLNIEPPAVQPLRRPVPERQPANAEQPERPAPALAGKIRMENARRRLIRARWRGSCNHQEWQKASSRRNDNTCEGCGKELPNFLLQCEGCHRRACVKCKRAIHQAFTPRLRDP